MEFTELSARAWEVRQAYSRWEKTKYGRAWSREDIILGFVGDVGDLAKLALA